MNLPSALHPYLVNNLIKQQIVDICSWTCFDTQTWFSLLSGQLLVNIYIVDYSSYNYLCVQNFDEIMEPIGEVIVFELFYYEQGFQLL